MIDRKAQALEQIEEGTRREYLDEMKNIADKTWNAIKNIDQEELERDYGENWREIELSYYETFEYYQRESEEIEYIDF